MSIPTAPSSRPSRLHLQPLALLIAALALLPAFAGSAQAEPRWARDQRDARPQDHAGQRPMREAIGEVEQNYRGHVVDVQSLRRDGGPDDDVYRMRVLQHDGRVKTVTVPAHDEHRR